MPTLFELCAGLPVKHVAAGEVLMEEGTRSGVLYLLESGKLEVLKGELRVAVLSHPGAVVGEMSVLLNLPHTATVRGLVPSTLRVAADPAAFLAAHPDACFAIAQMLAQRLDSLNRYLVDLKAQFEDRTDHLGMVDEVLESLMYHQRKPASR